MVRARKAPIRDYESDEETETESEEEEQPLARPARVAASKAPASRAQGQGASRGGASRGGAKGGAAGSSRGVDKGKQPARRSKKPTPPNANDSEEDIAPPSPSSELVAGLGMKSAILPVGYKKPFGEHSKKKMATIKKLRHTPPSTLHDDDDAAFEDYRFANIFQAHYYNTVIMAKEKYPILDQRFINWEACLSLNDPDLNEALNALENKGFKDIMTYELDWNEEVIAQFYATVWYTPSEEETNIPPYMHFAIQGVEYKCSYNRFARILGLPFDDEEMILMHTWEKPREEDLPLYHIDPSSRPWLATNLKPYYRYLNLLFRQTVMPKGGDEAFVRAHAQTILSFFTPGNNLKISVFDIIWREIQEASWDVKRSCSHAPYLMKMIRVVTKTRYVSSFPHHAYVPKLIKKPVGMESSAEPTPSHPLHPSSSRAAQAHRPMTYTRPARQSKGLGGAILRAVKSVFSICRDISVENQELKRRQQQLDDNFRRYVAGENLAAIPAISPPRPSQFIHEDLEQYHRARFGEDLYSGDEGQGTEEVGQEEEFLYTGAAEEEIVEEGVSGPHPYHGYVPPASSGSQEWDSWSHPPSAPHSSYRGWNG
jgi:hypothetical protein